MSTSSRIASIDGVRAVASLVVVVYHCSLIARPHLDPQARVWLTQSPAKLMLAGTEAVLVFFVLSGLVVALPVLRTWFSRWRYYPARLVRLYLPVAASLLLAAAMITLLPRDVRDEPRGTWTRDAHAATLDGRQLLREASLMPASYDINNVLWSLRWELIFSLTLPLFVGAALLVRRWALPAAALAAVLTVLGRVVDIDALVYLPVFFFGTLMAVRLDDLRAWCSRRRGPVFWPVLTAVAGTVLIASWLARPLVASDGVGGRVLWGVAGVGAALILVAAIGWPALARLLERPAPQWLGKISFSLYLVHAPLLGTLAFAWGSRQWALIALVGIPASILLAALFHRFVEAPGMRLARATGAAAERGVERARRRRTGPGTHSAPSSKKPEQTSS